MFSNIKWLDVIVKILILEGALCVAKHTAPFLLEMSDDELQAILEILENMVNLP